MCSPLKSFHCVQTLKFWGAFFPSPGPSGHNSLAEGKVGEEDVRTRTPLISKGSHADTKDVMMRKTEKADK